MRKNGIADDAERGARRLDELVEGFRQWREARLRGERIPAALWDAAVQMCQEHDLKRVACRLRVAPASLVRHLGGADHIAPKRSAQSAAFVEVFMSRAPAPTAEASRSDVPATPEPRAEFTPVASPAHECVVEMENEQGVKLRVRLNGLGLAQLASLCGAMGSVLCAQSRSAA